MAFSHSPNSALGRGFIQSKSPDELYAEEQRRDREAAQAEDAVGSDYSDLTAYIRRQWDTMRTHRQGASGWNNRLLKAQRVFNRRYDPDKLQDILKFGGSDIYAGVTATKCRGATSLLGEVYLQSEKAWGVEPTPEPTLPEPILDAIKTLVQAELQSAIAAGEQIDPTQVQDRIDKLIENALRASKAKARTEAAKAETRLNDLLTEGQFYKALTEFLVDLPIFPFACIKGPVVRVTEQLKWERDAQGGRARAVMKPTAKMYWNRVSPFDIFFTPGVSDIQDADVIEISRMSRADLNGLLGVPGFDEEKIRAAIRQYGERGLREWLDPTDTERAHNENRENPSWNRSGLIDCLEFHGNIYGKTLLDWGMEASEIQDPDRDYFVQAWVVGQYTIKVQIHPSPRKRPPYYITSFEKVPGTPVGNALPDILEDIQEVCNAVLRALVNNMSMASGPQVVVNEDRLAPGEDGDELYPWKRWRTTSDPFNGANNGQKPIDFFQPNDNSGQLLISFEKFSQMADDLSAIPRYTTGSDRMGGAGRTASGLAMLMGNANKILQTVCRNIDHDVIEPMLQGLYDMVMLADQNSFFRGDESIRVRGIEVAVQRETDRARQMEFLQNTANPIDTAIIGPLGRAKVLRQVSRQVGLDGEDIVPTEDELRAQLEQQAAAAQAQAEADQAAAASRQPGRAAIAAPPGQGTPPKPANTDLGVTEARAMRGIGG